MAAIRQGDEEQFERALSLGAGVNTTTTVEEGEFDHMSAGDVSALMLAIKVGCTQISQRLLERGADVHWSRPQNGMTVLWAAAASGEAEAVKLLASAEQVPRRRRTAAPRQSSARRRTATRRW